MSAILHVFGLQLLNMAVSLILTWSCLVDEIFKLMLNSSHHFWIRCTVYVPVHCFYCIFFWVHLSIVCHFTALLWKQSPLEHYGITVMYLKLSLKVRPLDYISLIILFRFWHYMCDTFAGWSCFSSMTETSLYLQYLMASGGIISSYSFRFPKVQNWHSDLNFPSVKVV